MYLLFVYAFRNNMPMVIFHKLESLNGYACMYYQFLSSVLGYIRNVLVINANNTHIFSSYIYIYSNLIKHVIYKIFNM